MCLMKRNEDIQRHTQMLTASFTKAQKLNSQSVPQKLKGQSKCSMYNGILLAIKRNEPLIPTTTLVSLKILLNERSPKQKGTYCVLCIIWVMLECPR